MKTGKFSRNLDKYLANHKDDRESGDYEVFSYIDQGTAETSIAEAKEFLKEGRFYLKKNKLNILFVMLILTNILLKVRKDILHPIKKGGTN